MKTEYCPQCKKDRPIEQFIAFRFCAECWVAGLNRLIVKTKPLKVSFDRGMHRPDFDYGPGRAAWPDEEDDI